MFQEALSSDTKTCFKWKNKKNTHVNVDKAKVASVMVLCTVTSYSPTLIFLSVSQTLCWIESLAPLDGEKNSTAKHENLVWVRQYDDKQINEMDTAELLQEVKQHWRLFLIHHESLDLTYSVQVLYLSSLHQKSTTRAENNNWINSLWVKKKSLNKSLTKKQKLIHQRHKQIQNLTQRLYY